MRAWILGAVGTVLASVSSTAAAQDGTTIDNWVLRSNEDVCWIQTYYGPDGNGVEGSVSIQMDWIDSWVGVSRGDWNLTDQTISAEVWYDDNVDRAADKVIGGTVENGVVFIDGGDDLTDRLEQSRYLAVRIGALNIFEGFDLGKTDKAVPALYDCADYLW